MYDINEIRKQFPMLTNNIKMQNKPLVFLDNCSTTFKPQCVIDVEMEYYTKTTSNSHRGDYDLSVLMDQKIDEARKTIAHFVNCEPNEVVFTSGTTASLNLVAFGYGLKFLKAGDEIIISEAEHASNILPWFEVAKLTGRAGLPEHGLLRNQDRRSSQPHYQRQAHKDLNSRFKDRGMDRSYK